ncbi:helix-turn-helix domain-containing protein [Pectobacterium parmentieri]|uniref:helix-turn-helix domain-containing protein n=1 Tax=Pectobacterium parmentieri TaxID=1905730 RepID=UPI001373ED60|nr:helix-turn-helix transcriptional regulator [Pectobacterium parmentieri]QHQ18310.1 helix-turn-helix domain-containing protein [Pectobacterium parmentieri]
MASIYSDEYQRVIKALREARVAKGITQESLAQALDRPQSFIAKVENGERRLDIVEFIHLSRLLSLDPISIINKIPTKHKPLNAK